jgi:hypothetical protein
MSMTHSELLELFKTEMADLIEKGLDIPFVRPIVTEEGEHVPGCDHDHPKPHTHELYTERSFIFDIRKIPATFHGFKLYAWVKYKTKPAEFCPPERTDEDIEKGIYRFLPIDEIYPPERVIAYAEENVLDICEQLNDYTFTLKDICDMIVSGDFDEHKKECEEARVRRILGHTP